jgi:tRNA(adenine34) deaminase
LFIETVNSNFKKVTDLLSDEFFMKEALKEAHKALDAGEVPIGAVIVSKQRIIARGHNLTETLNDPTAHAEMQAFTAATDYLGGKYLKDCVLYVTLEPCVMCGGASYWTQIGKIVYGASDAKRGYQSLNAAILHPKTLVVSGVMENECSNLLIDFFRSRR